MKILPDFFLLVLLREVSDESVERVNEIKKLPGASHREKVNEIEFDLFVQ